MKFNIGDIVEHAITGAKGRVVYVPPEEEGWLTVTIDTPFSGVSWDVRDVKPIVGGARTVRTEFEATYSTQHDVQFVDEATALKFMKLCSDHPDATVTVLVTYTDGPDDAEQRARRI